MDFRGYSLLDIKAIDDDQRIITGIASHIEADRDGDIFEPAGAEFSLPMPLLWQHDATRPIGEVLSAKPTAKAIQIKAQIASVTEPGPLKDWLDFAWQNLKHRLVKGLSIGYRGLDVSPIPNSFGLHFKRWLWLELSAVTIPANAAATITAIKSADAALLAASGRRTRVSLSSGLPDRSRIAPMNVAEQITARRAELKTKSARLEELMGLETLNETEETEQNELTRDVERCTGDVQRLTALQAAQQQMAKGIAAETPRHASDSRERNERRDDRIEVRGPVLPPGIGFARLIMCKMAAYTSANRGEFRNASDIAREAYPSMTDLHLALKAVIPPAITTTSTWAGALVYAETLVSDFLAFLEKLTILGKFGTDGIPPLKRVPFNSRIVGQDSGGTAFWVGQAKPKPLTKFDFSAQTLDFAKVAAISVIAEENARFSSPSAETLVRDGLAAALRRRLDEDFVDPSQAAVANVSPASITNGVTPLTPSGTSADAARADIGTLLSEFIENNVDPTGLVLIMPNTVALSLSLMRNSLGQQEFPTMTMRGGSLEGIPVIASQHAANASGSGNLVIAVNTTDVALADEGGISIDVSREAALEMKDSSLTQDGSVGTGVSLVSLWQNNLLGIRAERFITWKKLRTTAVSYMDDVAWGGAGSPPG